MTATFFPVRNFGGLALASPCLYPYSMILNSFCLEHTGSPFNPHSGTRLFKGQPDAIPFNNTFPD